MQRNICLLSKRYFSFVPKHKVVEEKDVEILRNFIYSSNNLVALTGAGISTESGIPDYRSEGVGLYARTNHKPVQYQEFVKDAAVRKRYWARNFVGWHRFSKVQPNDTHKVLHQLEDKQILSYIITQNVDNLHQKAGSQNVLELHGTAYKVICLNCGSTTDRHQIQDELSLINSHYSIDVATMIRPDGDVEIPLNIINQFCPPKCRTCGMDLKPDIVFFGDNVPKTTVNKVQSIISACDSLLILGSSLQVFSSYRIVLQALEEGKNICLVNIGPTRVDKIVNLKIAAKCSEILTKIK